MIDSAVHARIEAVGRMLGHESSAVEGHDTVDDPEGGVAVMKTMTSVNPAAMRRHSRTRVRVSAVLVEPGEGFVENQESGLAGQKTGDRDTTLLAAAQLFDVTIRKRVGIQADELQHVGDEIRPCSGCRGDVVADDWTLQLEACVLERQRYPSHALVDGTIVEEGRARSVRAGRRGSRRGWTFLIRWNRRSEDLHRATGRGRR